MRRALAVAAAALAGLAAGCGDETVEGLPPAAPATIRLTSAAFAEGEAIPRRYTCAGADVSPPLEWDGVPDRARALALWMEDPDVLQRRIEEGPGSPVRASTQVSARFRSCDLR